MNLQREVWAVVPVKTLSRSKRRLAPLLSRVERMTLARVMLEDVLAALRAAHGLAGIRIVTQDDHVANMVSGTGIDIIQASDSDGLAIAVERAARELSPRDAMLFVPADVPLITAQDIEVIVASAQAVPAVTLVPARADGGTNMLLCAPPEAIPLCFGKRSFLRHQQAARAAGIEPQIFRLPTAEIDIDRPEDVAALLAMPSATRTYGWLMESRIAERLPGHTRLHETATADRVTLSP
jgi:2-phospho-L-lactate guanylyltransferase